MRVFVGEDIFSLKIDILNESLSGVTAATAAPVVLELSLNMWTQNDRKS